MEINEQTYEAIVIGVSAGGLNALTCILPQLEKKMTLPILIVQHLSPGSDSFLSTHFSRICPFHVREAEDKDPIEPGTVYFAPPNYHLLIEPEKSIALSTEERVNFSRPSIDVLFQTAADAYLEHLIGVLLTGANSDGADGLKKINSLGGLTIVQDPKTAEADTMPRAAIKNTRIDHILPLDRIADFLNRLTIKGKQ